MVRICDYELLRRIENDEAGLPASGRLGFVYAGLNSPVFDVLPSYGSDVSVGPYLKVASYPNLPHRAFNRNVVVPCQKVRWSTILREIAPLSVALAAGVVYLGSDTA